MAKKSKKNKRESNTNVNIVLPNTLSSDEMQQIIANAILSAEEASKQRVLDQKEKEQDAFRKAMGYKDYSNEKGLKKHILVFFNRTIMLLKLLFAPKHYIQGDAATFGLLKLFIEAFFWLAKAFTTLFALLLIVYMPLQFIVETIPTLSFSQNFLIVSIAFIAFVLSRMLRMASVEVDKLEDRTLLFGIFASVSSIVSIVLAIIAVVK